MNNEPVAWMREDCYRGITWGFQKIYDDDIPLYTHPAKTLTDEEIGEVMKQCDWQYDPESFARAILIKAQEK